MRNRIAGLAGLLVLGLGLLLVGRWLSSRDDGQAVPTQALTPPVPTMAAPVPSATAKASALPATVEALWAVPPVESEFAPFAEWTRRHAAAAPADRAALEAEGVALARARLTAMANLVQTNPERALELAVPSVVRGALPASVQALLEQPVNARGDLEVIAFRPLPGQEQNITPVLRYAEVDGARSQVFTYGRGLEFITKRGVPLHGLRVPAEAATRPPPNNGLAREKFLMALHESPARRLAPAEVAAFKAAQAQEPICGTSGLPWTAQGEETAVQLAGEIHTFCGQVHAEDWAHAHVAAAGMDLPGGDGGPVTAESSYTEGRKRMLLLRPYWSDYAGMATNDAITHWVNFSNYMFQMSYGKMVFAPLGKGSAISTEIVLSGSVANYTSGLGNAPSTWGAVRTAAAGAPYNYVLGDYDFVYYCTRGEPSASYAGLGFVGGVGFHLANSYFDAAVSSHEFGHNLGLNHAHFWDSAQNSIIGTGQNVEYGDSNDPMGGGGNPNQYNSRYKNYLGWIPDADVANLNSTGSGTYRLYTFDLDNSTTGLRGLRFTYSGSQNYWIHFRQRKSGKALQNGAQLLWTGNGNQGSYLLDVRLKGNADNNAVVIGRTYSDTNLNFHFTPVGKGHTVPESLDIVVRTGSQAGNLLPALVVSATPTNPATGATVTFSAAASDPNGDALAYHWDFGDGDYSVDNKAVTTHAFSAGEYTVQCTASDMRGGTARRSVIVRAGNPSTFRISGRVLDAQNRPLAGILVRADTGRSAYTDTDGTYTLTGLAAGNHTLEAIEPLRGTMSFVHPYFNNPVTVGPSVTTANFVGVFGSLNIYTPLSAKGASSWRYFDKGVNQGTAWRANGFNDSGWSNGVAPLGYPSGSPIATVVSFGPDAQNKYVTTYARRSFVVANPSIYTNLLLETLRDDGVIVYLNGTEVFRDNLPTNTVTYSTYANDTVDPDAYFQTTLSAGLLVAGTNWLAAEVHQGNPTSSDIAIDVGLSGLNVSNATGFNIVYVSSPPDQSVFTPPTNVTITAAVFSGGTVTNVEFHVDGVKVADDATPPYSFLLTDPSAGTHSLRVVASIGGTRATSAPVSITVSAPSTGAPPVSLALVSPGASWKYLAQSSAAPANWASFAFGDGAWPTGPAQLGYGEGDEATVLPYGGDTGNRWPTYYFRRAFTVNDPGSITDLTVQLKRDDGGIVYLNGTEVFRSNITNATVTYATLAFSADDDGTNFHSETVEPLLLRPGTNVIAVEIHQAALNSSDVSFDLRLDALASTNRPRGVYLTLPGEGASVTGQVSIAADVVAGGTLGVVRTEFYADDVKIGEDTSAPYTFVWNNAAPGPHVLTAVATDTASGAITSAPVSITVAPPPASTALISFGELWKYRDEGTDPGTTWRNRIFNDSQWMAGPARLGYGGDGELTAVSFGTNANNKHITTYFRRAFTVVNPAAFNRLLLRLTRDDGAVVYLNGTEVFRDNLQAGAVSWNSTALAGIDGAAETTPLDVVLPTTGLLAGTNVVAVEAHQVSITSSDLGFDLSLTGLDDTNTTFGVYLASPADGARFNTPANVPLSAYAAAPQPIFLVEYFAGTMLVGQSATPPYAVTWGGAPAGTHPLTARVTYGDGLTMTSAPVTIIVGPPPPPILPVFTTLMQPMTGPWKYWDSAANLGTGWQNPSFDDSAWPGANTRFGWGLDGEMSLLTEGRVTHYFRRWVNVANGPQLAELLLYLVRDDGAVVYLNGTEVFRSNMPPGPVDAGTLASASVNTPDETTWYSTVLATAGSGMLSGSNLVAVELHQSSANSSDASFDFALYGQGTTERRVYLGSPAQNSSYQNTAGIPIEAFALPGGSLTISKIEFFAGTNKLGEATVAPYRMTWYGAPYGTHLLRARMTDSASVTQDSALVTVNVTRELVTTTLIASNSVWRYFDGGVSQGTNWVGLNFNDGTWASGPARLGFGGDGEVTLINGGPSNARFPTTYFRHKFTTMSGVVYTNLLFKLVRDDGAVVHLNGREAYRDNMPGGPITYGTYTGVGTTDEQAFFATNIAVTNLSATNIVAVEVHQANATSGDLGFNLELIASGYLEDSTPPVVAIVLADGMVELTWPGSFTGWRVYAAATVNAPPGGWQPIAATPAFVGGQWIVTVNPTASAQFFRLGRP